MERAPIQKEFGEIERTGNHIQVKRFGGDQIGQVTLSDEQNPIPHCHAHWLWISRREQGKGFASQLLAEVERISRERGLPAVLIDDIRKRNSPEAIGMYRRRGWAEIPAAAMHNRRYKDVYVYGASEEQLDAFRWFYASKKR